jgi:hypothetical protein
VPTWDLFVSWTWADPPLVVDVVAFVTDAAENRLDLAAEDLADQLDQLTCGRTARRRQR